MAKSAEIQEEIVSEEKTSVPIETSGIKTQEEANRIVAEKTETSKFFCPLFGGTCNHACPAYKPAYTMRNPRLQTWSIVGPLCTSPSVVQN